jgi:hypothetical protein
MSERKLSSDEFYQDKSMAVPEQRFKNDILQAMTLVIEAEQVLIRNKRLNNGIANQNDLAEFESRLVSLFSYLKFLIKKSEKLSLEDSALFSSLVLLECGRSKVDFFQMQTFKNFLLKKILRLGITDILRKERKVSINDDF